MKKRQIKAWFSAAIFSVGATHATAQDFPSRPVTLVAPYPAGSATDKWHALIKAAGIEPQ